jgi:hypothetical protein
MANRGSILVNDRLDVRKNGGFIWITKLDDFLPCLRVISTCCGIQQGNMIFIEYNDIWQTGIKNCLSKSFLWSN